MPAVPLESRLLQALAPWREAGGWCVAFSGGLDSTVLLHLLAQLARSEALPALSALHVHHGLQAAADGWPAHCQVVCRSLGFPLRVERVQVAVGGSIEQAARDARYRAFQANLGEGQVLLTAQHLDDQAETLLFRLLRGAGLRGLAAMPASRPLGGGRLCRPLLGVSRAELEAYAQTHRLDWVEDPSNQDPRFSRNYLRREIMPRLASHWPQAVAGMARCAAHLREAEDLLAELAAIDLRACRQPSELDWPDWLDLPRIALEPLRRLSAARQRNLLRAWLGQLTRLPDSDHWAGWESLRDAGDDADPIWRLESGELRRGAGRIWWLPADWRAAAGPFVWERPAHPLLLPGNGRLALLGEVPAGPLRVDYRRGGEVLALAGRGRRDLKRLLNEAGVPSFLRGRLPLLFRADELLAVANIPGLDSPREGGWRLSWSPPTNDPGLS
ncbi:TPA: tRNA lysidine(34) synthetase TilS [Pseudomonas aeruginosa]|uniref:tRNA lysidine(34) synthetase TilS n=1 Tax=Pseudomonas aeruginosa TaxID=287 RepID=UPI00068B9291|nr:tRNA lysidine(34) synthetase TilS [Pseudomonas aeruginosa]HBN7765030.1 tRNA lysidine(34) synthetase TilS [Pseudomonas aeruginosa]HBN9084261.1 tRNA lysidine(34) synthetase TilS [Pseudomonas aeruginosa]HEQ1797000.1 tRNA lysidine(34) synthetase TilS [Pseudomonas aeruginosa]HEQ1810226.1 tRNA lysidine(34) synthetase TilS [Pseudomonas aeruginosa]HEQ1816873.1 tRNA lysidine(34) synthetase TilS [Pseudomonas aeruginosa]